MALKLTPAARALFDAKNFANVATLNEDGSPQVSPVWIGYDGEHVIFNTEKTRLKTRNMKRDPRVALSVQSLDNLYQYVEVRGKVVEITEEGGGAGIDAMSKKYLGQDKYPGTGPGDVRVNVKVAIEHIAGQGI